MRVLFHCRPNIFEHPGGDTIQILGTKKYLEELGTSIDISMDSAPEARGYDVFHVFNPALVSLRGLLRARRSGVPVAISTLYWPMEGYFRGYFSLAQFILRYKPPWWPKHALGALTRCLAYTYPWNSYFENRLRYFFTLANLLLPNSRAEGNVITRYLGVERPWQVVPNGVEVEEFDNGRVPKTLQGLREYVVCVGRLEPRKNQHLLIEALMDTEMPLVFVGQALGVAGYEGLCRKLGAKRGNTHFIDRLPHQSVRAVYRHARVHALPSWYETPGLSNLEAAVAGCAVATTEIGGTKEYFGDFAHYCRPPDVGSIRRAVLDAYQERGMERLRRRVLARYSWRETAVATLRAYHRVVRAKRSDS